MVAPIFEQRDNRNLWQATGTTLMLIYNEAVHQLRASDQNALIGLMKSVMQALVMISMFMGMFLLMGVKHSPIRGDYIMYILSGMFLFLVHTAAVASVGAGSAVSGLLKHRPLNTAILICAGALASLYRQIFTITVILTAYYCFGNEIQLEYPLMSFSMILFSWFYGVCVGMVFLAITPWWPMVAGYGRTFYMRLNMIASGKMFVANTLPGFMLAMFDWNPLFHIIDQARGFIFVNYTPFNSNLSYPLKVSLVLLTIGMMGEFVTRRSQSLSWGNRAN